MRWLSLIASVFCLFLLAGCNAPENPTYTTKLSILKPWDNQADGKPIFTSLDTHLYLSYLLADNALVKADNMYEGKARFKLILNGIDITDKQRKAVCGTESFSAGYVAEKPTTTDAVTCNEYLKGILEKGYKLESINYSEGFIVRNIGSGGEIEFVDLQSIESALIAGTNTLTLQSIAGATEAASVQFVYFGQSPQIIVKSVTSSQGSNVVGIGESYELAMEVVGDTPLLQLPYDDSIGEAPYAITFFDRTGEISRDRVAISEGGRKIDLQLDYYPDVNASPVKKADIYYEFTDATGKKQRKGLLLSGRKLKNFMGLQINGSFFNAFEPVLSVMLNNVVETFLPQLYRFFKPYPLDENEKRAVVGGSIRVPRLASGELADNVKLVCDTLLNEEKDDKRQCGFYTSVQTIRRQPEIDIGFEGKDGVVTPKLHVDIVFPELLVDVEVAAYDKNAQDLDYRYGTYRGSFKTTIVFKDVAIRDTFSLAGTRGAFMQGITEREGYSLRSTNDYYNKIADILLPGSGNKTTYNPELRDTFCTENLCDLGVLGASGLEGLSNLFALPVRGGVIKSIEEQLDQILPPVLSDFISKFPDINGIREMVNKNKADQVVSEATVKDSITDNAQDRQLVRNLTTEYVGVKDLNVSSDILGKVFGKLFGDIGANYAGMMRFDGGYQVNEKSSQQLASQQYVTSFVDTDKVDFTPWKHSVNVAKPGEDAQIDQVDMVASLSLNAINQYVASEYQLNGLDDWLNETFPVERDSPDIKYQTLSRMVSRFNGVVQENDVVALSVTHTHPPEISFVGGKASKWQYSYDMLFGLLKGGKSDTMVTPAVKISFYQSRVQLSKMNNGKPDPVFDVNANLSIEANITFEDGLPKLYIKTPQAPLATYEKAAEKRLDKRLVFDINAVNYLDSNVLTDEALVADLIKGVPKNPADPRLKVQVVSPFIGVYQDQNELYYLLADGVETFFDSFMMKFMRDHFSKKIEFSDYDDKVKLVDGIAWGMSAFFKGSNAIEIKGQIKWFTVDTSGAWLNFGVDLKHEVLSGDCDEELDPLTLCYQ